jgi:hypothetical protein
VLLAFEPLKGRRELRVSERRRKQEFAQMMRYLLDDHYPQVERIRLVVDNLKYPLASSLLGELLCPRGEAHL